MDIAFGTVLSLLLVLLGIDHSRGALLTAPAHYLVVALVIACLGAGHARRPSPNRTEYRRLLTLGLILAFLLVGVAGLRQVALEKAEKHWAAGGRERLLATEGDIRREFSAFLTRLTDAPVPWIQKSPDGDRATRFRRLREAAATVQDSGDRYGWTLWRGEAPDSWAGRTSAARAPDADAVSEQVQVLRRGAAFMLLSTKPLADGFLLQGEYLLGSPLEHQIFLPLSALKAARREERITLQPLTPDQVSEEATLFDSRSGDHRWEAGAGGIVVSFPLRSPGGRPLVIVRLQDTSEETVRERILHRSQAAALVLSFLGILGGAAIVFRISRSAPHSPLAFLAFSAFLWGARLLPLGFRGIFHGLALFNPERFACGLAWGLLKSPADLLITAALLALNLQAWDRWLATRSLSAPTRKRLALVHLPVLVFLGAFLLRLAWDAPQDARFEVLKVDFVSLDWARLMVQTGLFLFSSAFLAFVTCTARLLRDPHPAPPPASAARFPVAVRFYGLVALATALYLPVVAFSTLRQRENFFSEKLSSRVENQQMERRVSLWAVLNTLHASGEIGEVLRRYASDSGEGLAYELWAASRLDEIGLSSSLRIFSEDGTLLGRFGLNLPSGWESRPPPSREQASVRSFLTPPGAPRQRILVGETSRSLESGGTLRFQVHLLDEPRNLPFIRADNLYVQLFPRPRTQETNPELLGAEPLVAIYDTAGKIRFSSLEEGPDLAPAAATLAPRQSVWAIVRAGENSFRVYYKKAGDWLLAVGFPLPSRLEQTGAFVRTTLLGFLASVVMALLLRIIAGPSSSASVRQGPFFRRLAAMSLAASLIPLLLLSFFLHRFVMREINEDIRTEGLASLGAARRIVRDYLTIRPGPEESHVDDDVAFWVSQVVRQDINLYVAENLSATSAREIYASGLLPARIDPRVYERLVLRGDAYALNEEKMGGLAYQTVSAPVSPGDPSQKILSLPLVEKKQEIVRKRADVEEAILIVTVGMLLLLTILSHSLARRVSEPVVALSRAARRIESGDFDAEVRVVARDEPALLIDSFNRMAASLRRQREDLRRRRDYIEKILLNVTTGVISTDPGDRVVTVNPAARLLLGLPPSGGEGTPLSALLEPFESLAPLREALSRSGPGRERTWQIPLAGPRARLALRLVSLPFRETPESPPGRILLLEDLTEAMRSSRLEAWADMARRIAHEIKNPLTPIQLSADHLRKVYRSGDPRFDIILEECLDTIQKQVQGLRRIAGEFSDYARIPQIRPERVPPAGILDDALNAYRTAPPEGVILDSSVLPGTPDLWVDRALTTRALINLVQNALEAMTGGGRLSIHAEEAPRAAGSAQRKVRILLADNGPGMDAETLSRVFEPYFSTKETGTGLGLSIVRRTVEDQGGRIEVKSSPGSGTQVILDLPAAGEEGESEKAGAPATI